MPAKNTVGSMISTYESYQSDIIVAIFYCYKFGIRSLAQIVMYSLFFINMHSVYKTPISKYAN